MLWNLIPKAALKTTKYNIPSLLLSFFLVNLLHPVSKSTLLEEGHCWTHQCPNLISKELELLHGWFSIRKPPWQGSAESQGRILTQWWYWAASYFLWSIHRIMHNYIIGAFDTNCILATMICRYRASGKASGRLAYYCLLSVNTLKLIASLGMLGWANHLFVFQEPFWFH